jgi:maleylacetoacetate isomerase
MSMLRLYGYWRSSAAYRVRIALELKSLSYEYAPVHLVRGGGEQRQPDYRRVNPQGRVPSLEHDGRVLTQSLAIIEYLDESWPEPALLPSTPAARARVRALADLVACDIHPLNNLRVLQYLSRTLGQAEPARDDWYRHWIADGFTALEVLLAGSADTGRYCHGDTPGLADACLVPQVYNARRYNCDLEPFPTIARIEQSCNALAAFERARPERQPDAE